MADQRTGEGALASTRRAGDPDGVRMPAERVCQAPDLAGSIVATLDQRQQPGDGDAVAFQRGGQELIGLVARHTGTDWQTGRTTSQTTAAMAASASATLTTSVTPSTRSRMIRSIPPLSVWVDTGQVPQAPIRRTLTTPVVSSTSTSSMSPRS